MRCRRRRAFLRRRMRSGSHPRPGQMKRDLVLKFPDFLPERPVLHGWLPDDRREQGDLVILRLSSRALRAFFVASMKRSRHSEIMCAGHRSPGRRPSGSLCGRAVEQRAPCVVEWRAAGRSWDDSRRSNLRYKFEPPIWFQRLSHDREHMILTLQ